MQEIQIIKENVIQIKETQNKSNHNNTHNSANFNIRNRELIEGKKIYIETSDELNEMEIKLEETEFFQKVVRAMIVTLYINLTD